MTDDHDLSAALTRLAEAEVLTGLESIIRDTRRRNAERFEDGLGDDTVALGFTNWRNIINLAERHFADNPVVGVTRPSNSFQLHVDDLTLNVYALRGTDPMAVTWTSSGMKERLAEGNSLLAGELGHIAPTFEDVLAETDGDETFTSRAALPLRHLVLLHWSDRDASNVRMWIGFPRDNSLGGDPWLQLREISAEARRDTGTETPMEARPAYRDRKVPEVEVRWTGAKPGAATQDPGA